MANIIRWIGLFLLCVFAIVDSQHFNTKVNSDYDEKYDDPNRSVEIETEFAMEVHNEATSQIPYRQNRRITSLPPIRRSWVQNDNYNQDYNNGDNRDHIDRQGYGGGGGCGGCGGCCGGGAPAYQQPNLLSLLALLFSILLPLLFLLYYISQNNNNTGGGGTGRREIKELIDSYPSLASFFPDVMLDGPTWLSMVHELWEQDDSPENMACIQETLCRMNRLAMAAPGQAGWAVSLSSLPLSYLLHARHTGGFTSYVDAALMGRSGANCTELYSSCPRLQY